MTTSTSRTTKTRATTTTGTPRARKSRPRGVDAIRAHLANDPTPIVFVGPTPFNLLGLDRWLPGLRFVSQHDPFDGAHPRLFSPPPTADAALVTGADVVNHLLADPEVRAHLAALATESGAEPKITSVYVDDETERLCAELGYQLIAASVADRELVAAAVEPAAEDTALESTATSRPLTVAAVVTRRGIVVGSTASSLVGVPELTLDPYAWSGAETHPRQLTTAQRSEARTLVEALGNGLADEGFRGYLEAHLLVDEATGGIRLSAATAGIGAATALTTATPTAYVDLPLYALHVLEHLGVSFELNVADLNRRAADLAVFDTQTQLVITETGPEVELLADAPVSGRYLLDELGRAHLVERSLDWHDLADPAEFFFLRLAGPGDPRWLGADLGVVVARGRGRTMIDSLRAGFVGVPAFSVDLAYA